MRARLSAALAWVTREVGAQELIMLAGMAALGVGIGAWSIPAACAVVGALCVRLAWPTPPVMVVPPPTRRRSKES